MSTSRNKRTALEFADSSYQFCDKKCVGVLLKIELKKKQNFFVYNEETSAFPNEEEVLLQEGLEFKINGYEELEDEIKGF